MAAHSPTGACALPLSAAELTPLLAHLLNAPEPLAAQLAHQAGTAITELDEDSRPDSYEGLLDVARYCVEDDPRWSDADRVKLASSHPRIGETGLTGPSAAEQRGGDTHTLTRLARLNALYEQRFPTLVWTTFVNARPREVLADELDALLGEASKADPAAFPETLINAPGSETWEQELERNLEALWAIAYDRAVKLAEGGAAAKSPAASPVPAASPPPVSALDHDLVSATAPDSAPALASKSAPSPAATPPTHESQTTPVEERSPKGSSGSATRDSPTASGKQAELVEFTQGKEEPFVSLATLRLLALSSPVLESFFETDLQQSFSLVPPERSESGGAFAWHAAPTSGSTPRNLPGAGGSSLSSSSYSRDVTTGAKGRVVGFLGGLLGEEGKAKMDQLADSVGSHLQTKTVIGPVPSFAHAHSQEEEGERRAAERKTTFGTRLVDAVRASAWGEKDRPPTPPPKETKSEENKPLPPEDLSVRGPQAAAQQLRAAATQERSHFIIDEVAEGEGAADAEPEPEGADETDLDGIQPLEAGNGRLEGREAQLAKDLRSAPAQ